MKKQIWNNGTRDLWGSDLTMIQNELQQALENGILNDIGICVLSEIGITANSPLQLDGTGYVYLYDSAGENGKICKVPATTAVGDVLYLTQTSINTTDTYGDGSTQTIWTEYIADVSETAPGHANYIKIDTGDVDKPTFKQKIIEDYPALIESTSSSADLNNLKTAGKYRMTAAATNNPSGNLGHLFVMQADLITQMFIDNAGGVFVRTYQGGMWGAWFGTNTAESDTENSAGISCPDEVETTVLTHVATKAKKNALLIADFNELKFSNGGADSDFIAEVRIYKGTTLLKELNLTKAIAVGRIDKYPLTAIALSDVNVGDTITIRVYFNSFGSIACSVTTSNLIVR